MAQLLVWKYPLVKLHNQLQAVRMPVGARVLSVGTEKHWPGHGAPQEDRIVIWAQVDPRGPDQMRDYDFRLLWTGLAVDIPSDEMNEAIGTVVTDEASERIVWHLFQVHR